MAKMDILTKRDELERTVFHVFFVNIPDLRTKAKKID